MSTKLNPFFFTSRLLHWHRNFNNRILPWKSIKEPYKIWLSEIILQQTRAEQGLSFYLKFIENFPKIQDLAKATDEKVFKLWEGLGYYSRCKNLLHSARFISNELNGHFPETYESLLQLKGVGPYTAAAIASFAYDTPHAVVDGNVFRVLSRFFGNDTPVDLPEGKKWFQEKAKKLLDKTCPAEYNQAIMDFGATVCTPKLPDCKNCVLQQKCIAYHTNMVQSLPVKAKKMVREELFFYYLIITSKDNVLLRKRIEKNIWENLNEFYLVSSEKELSNPSETAKEFFKLLPVSGNRQISVSKKYTQLLTHKKVNATFLHFELPSRIQIKGYTWVKKKEINNYAFPRIIYNYLQENTL